jgi:excisionase family DNA binding protein
MLEVLNRVQSSTGLLGRTPERSGTEPTGQRAHLRRRSSLELAPGGEWVTKAEVFKRIADNCNGPSTLREVLGGERVGGIEPPTSTLATTGRASGPVRPAPQGFGFFDDRAGGDSAQGGPIRPVSALASGILPARTGRLRAVDGGADNLLTVRQVAAKLCVSTAAVYKLVDRGALPHLRILNAIRVAPSDLEAFVASQRRGGK